MYCLCNDWMIIELVAVFWDKILSFETFML